jgi:hypothetical protein
MKLIAVAFAATAAVAQAPPRVVIDYPLASLRAPYVQTSAPLLSAIDARPGADGPRAILSVPDPNAQKTDYDFGGVLQEMFAGAHEHDLEVRTFDSVLLLDGTPAAVDGARRTLDAIAAALTQAIAVTLTALPLPDGELPPAVLGAADAQQLLQKHAPLWRATGTTRNGVRIALGREKWAAYVRGIEVEAVQSKMCGDPKVGSLFAGVRLVCEVHRVPDGRAFVVNGALAFSETLAVTETATAIEGMPTVDLPDTVGAFAPFGARVADGGAAVLAARCERGLGPSFLLVVQVKGQGRPPAPPPGLVVLPVSSLLAPGLLGGRMVSPSLVPFEVSDSNSSEPAADRFLTPDSLGGLLAAAAGESETIQDAPEQGCLILRREPASALKLEAAVCERVAQLQNVELQFTVPRREGGAPLIDLRLPTIAGRHLTCFVGLERTAIEDFSIEIAQAASAYNPVIELRRSGLSAHLALNAAGDALHAGGALLLAAQGERRPRVLHGEPPGTLGFIDSDAVAIPWDAPLPWDDTTVFGDGPDFTVGGKPVATRLQLRLVRR